MLYDLPKGTNMNRAECMEIARAYTTYGFFELSVVKLMKIMESSTSGKPAHLCLLQLGSAFLMTRNSQLGQGKLGYVRPSPHSILMFCDVGVLDKVNKYGMGKGPLLLAVLLWMIVSLMTNAI